MTLCLDANGKPKDRYGSRRKATEHMEKRLRENPTLYLRVYHCSACGLWHMTHKPDRYEKEVAA